MGRQVGTLKLSSNIEPRVAAPFDARSKVALKSDLTASGTFPYPYEGMEVYVVEEKKKYILIGDDPTVLSNWKEAGSGGGSVDDAVTHVETVPTPTSYADRDTIIYTGETVIGYTKGHVYRAVVNDSATMYMYRFSSGSSMYTYLCPDETLQIGSILLNRTVATAPYTPYVLITEKNGNTVTFQNYGAEEQDRGFVWTLREEPSVTQTVPVAYFEDVTSNLLTCTQVAPEITGYIQGTSILYIGADDGIFKDGHIYRYGKRKERVYIYRGKQFGQTSWDSFYSLESELSLGSAIYEAPMGWGYYVYSGKITSYEIDASDNLTVTITKNSGTSIPVVWHQVRLQSDNPFSYDFVLGWHDITTPEIQKETLPEPSVSELNKIYQYTGNGAYTNGWFYKCIKDDDNNYFWEPLEFGGAAGDAVVYSDTKPKAHSENNEYANGSVVCYTGTEDSFFRDGHLYKASLGERNALKVWHGYKPGDTSMWNFWTADDVINIEVGTVIYRQCTVTISGLTTSVIAMAWAVTSVTGNSITATRIYSDEADVDSSITYNDITSEGQIVTIAPIYDFVDITAVSADSENVTIIEDVTTLPIGANIEDHLYRTKLNEIISSVDVSLDGSMGISDMINAFATALPTWTQSSYKFNPPAGELWTHTQFPNNYIIQIQCISVYNVSIQHKPIDSTGSETYTTIYDPSTTTFTTSINKIERVPSIYAGNAAEQVLDRVALMSDIGGGGEDGTSIFYGTMDEWNALTTDAKKQYDYMADSQSENENTFWSGFTTIDEDTHTATTTDYDFEVTLPSDGYYCVTIDLSTGKQKVIVFIDDGLGTYYTFKTFIAQEERILERYRLPYLPAGRVVRMRHVGINGEASGQATLKLQRVDFS